MEARVFALNHRVVTLYGILSNEKDDFQTNCEDLVFDLGDAATGGNFQVRDRPAEPRRYIQISQRAMNVVKETRRFQREMLRSWLW